MFLVLSHSPTTTGVSPAQSLPPNCGGMHFLVLVLNPIPQEELQEDHEDQLLHFPSTEPNLDMVSGISKSVKKVWKIPHEGLTPTLVNPFPKLHNSLVPA